MEMPDAEHIDRRSLFDKHSMNAPPSDPLAHPPSAFDEENAMILMIDRLNHALAESRGREDLGFNEHRLQKCSQRTCMQRLGVYLPADWKPDPQPSLAVRKQQFERRWSGVMAPVDAPNKAAPLLTCEANPSSSKSSKRQTPKSARIGRVSTRHPGNASTRLGGPRPAL